MNERQRARENRREFERYVSRVFAPYAHFRRNRETGSYLNHSVQVAHGIWQAALYSSHRPIVDAFGKPIDETRSSDRQKSKGASRRKRRPVMTRTARSKKWQR